MTTKTPTLTVEITHSKWAWSDPKKPVVLGGGEHVLENPVEGLVRALGAAAAAGQGVRILDGSPALLKLAAGAVESDDDSLAFQAKTDAIRAELLPQRDERVEQAELELLDARDAASDDEAAHAAALEAFNAAVDAAVAWHEQAADALIQERLG